MRSAGVPSSTLPSAVLFDLDGTLVDTEPYWLRAETLMIERFGGTWTSEQALQMVGLGLHVTAGILQGYGVPLGAEEIVEELTDTVAAQLAERIPWQPGALELLQAANDAGLPTALVTMSIRRMAETVAAAVPAPGFGTIVSGSDVDRPKPDPEAYLRAATLLGVDITAAVAIEDSPPGLASAFASGAIPIGVPHLIPLPAGDGWDVWPTLAGRTLDDIRGVAARRIDARALTTDGPQ